MTHIFLSLQQCFEGLPFFQPLTTLQTPLQWQSNTRQHSFIIVSSLLLTNHELLGSPELFYQSEGHRQPTRQTVSAGFLYLPLSGFLFWPRRCSSRGYRGSLEDVPSSRMYRSCLQTPGSHGSRMAVEKNLNQAFPDRHALVSGLSSLRLVENHFPDDQVKLIKKMSDHLTNLCRLASLQAWLCIPSKDWPPSMNRSFWSPEGPGGSLCISSPSSLVSRLLLEPLSATTRQFF